MKVQFNKLYIFTLRLGYDLIDHLSFQVEDNIFNFSEFFHILDIKQGKRVEKSWYLDFVDIGGPFVILPPDDTNQKYFDMHMRCHFENTDKEKGVFYIPGFEKLLELDFMRLAEPYEQIEYGLI